MPDGSGPSPEAEAIAREVHRAGLAGDRQMGAVFSAFLRGVMRVEGASDELHRAFQRIEAATERREPLPPDAVDRFLRSAAAAAGPHFARIKWWIASGAVALALCGGLGLGYGVGRHELLGEVHRVEVGLSGAMAVPTASAYLQMMRNNPGGVVEVRRYARNGGEVTEGRWWSRLPEVP